MKTLKFIYDFTKYGYQYGIQGQTEILKKGQTPLLNVCFLLNFINILENHFIIFKKHNIREYVPPWVLCCARNTDK